MLSITASFDLEGYEQQLEAQLAKIQLDENRLRELGQIVVDDIKEGIDKGLDLSGNPFIPNTSKWIRRKGNSTPFRGKTGNLYNSIKVKDVGADYVTVRVFGGGVYWQNPTRHPAFKRVFFGVSIRIKNKINEWLTSNK